MISLRGLYHNNGCSVAQTWSIVLHALVRSVRRKRSAGAHTLFPRLLVRWWENALLWFFTLSPRLLCVRRIISCASHLESLRGAAGTCRSLSCCRSRPGHDTWHMERSTIVRFSYCASHLPPLPHIEYISSFSLPIEPLFVLVLPPPTP